MPYTAIQLCHTLQYSCTLHCNTAVTDTDMQLYPALSYCYTRRCHTAVSDTTDTLPYSCIRHCRSAVFGIVIQLYPIRHTAVLTLLYTVPYSCTWHCHRAVSDTAIQLCWRCYTHCHTVRDTATQLYPILPYSCVDTAIQTAILYLTPLYSVVWHDPRACAWYREVREQVPVRLTK